jgi:hypothetical protein
VRLTTLTLTYIRLSKSSSIMLSGLFLLKLLFGVLFYVLYFLRGMKLQEGGEKCIMRSFTICILRQILLGC